METEAGGLTVRGQPGLHSDTLFQQNKMNKTRPNPNRPPLKVSKNNKNKQQRLKKKKKEPQTRSNLKPWLCLGRHYQVFNRLDKAAQAKARPGLFMHHFLAMTSVVTLTLKDPWHFTARSFLTPDLQESLSKDDTSSQPCDTSKSQDSQRTPLRRGLVAGWECSSSGNKPEEMTHPDLKGLLCIRRIF